MTNNDILRSLRYLLDSSEPKMLEVIGLTGQTLARDQLATYLKKDDEEGFAECPAAVLSAYLDGLIIERRGPSDRQPAPEPMSHNLVLKKLRVAFELREDDVIEILKQANFRVSKPELTALFRKPDHKNYRPCGDQFLRNFLKGLTLRLRG
ncbi:DUF1456 family protein [Crenobacter sp. SG2303]|uniref:DUF1456 family protein n=2 Tax=Crenobacter oryzisoli TaxID=3056844 RepID=A0ABT7XMH4_9NEIS|nr:MULTISPECIES: DUF1456 family protein [unclassified Crenobacter]MDN0074987.1 DUF1456 family protein [Crenobacter sp. SG2303]MDN0081228.1 DUF1456 family protein [Crenobacter sp. SG2305]